MEDAHPDDATHGNAPQPPAQDPPASQMIPMPGHWIESLTIHSRDLRRVRFLFARGSRDEPTLAPDLDDLHIRIQDVMKREDGQETQAMFDVLGLASCPGPRALAAFIWSEGQAHYRAVCVEARRNDEALPRRLRIVVQLLDAEGLELDELTGYTGRDPARERARAAHRAGVTFVEDTEAHNSNQSPSFGRINGSLEKGYLTMVKHLNTTIDKRMSDADLYAKSIRGSADQYAEAREAGGDRENDLDDEIALAGIQLAGQLFGQKQERNAKAENVKAGAPKDGGPGGPACAFARQALPHFTEEVIDRCRKNIGTELTEATLQSLRYAEEQTATDKALLSRFRRQSEAFIELYQKKPEAIRACIPAGAIRPLDALFKLSMA